MSHKPAGVLLSGLMMLFCLTTLPSAKVHAEDKGGFSLGSTRVIYDGSKKEASVTVINSAKNAPFLAQSWVPFLPQKFTLKTRGASASEVPG
ncbi:fimbria/pilus periplasmic chaperone [Salmonella enterica subsp. enterica serovar Pomona]|nr:fimbria/pilus periplasmic chaperone [Salmonella enterica subsp. enterica serovar Pomona]